MSYPPQLARQWQVVHLRNNSSTVYGLGNLLVFGMSFLSFTDVISTFLQVEIVTSDKTQLPRLVETYKLLLSQLVRYCLISIFCMIIFIAPSTQWDHSGATFTVREWVSAVRVPYSSFKSTKAEPLPDHHSANGLSMNCAKLQMK